MKDRVYGLESEYAVVFQPLGAGVARPTPRHVYNRLEAFVRKRCKTLPARHRSGLFLENGGRLHFEGDLDEGVIKVSTPECRSARQAVIYQEAMDALLTDILPNLTERLRLEGYHGTVVLGRNATDNKGHFYGAQENYSVSGSGRRWLLWPVLALFTMLFCPLQALSQALPLVPLLLLLAVGRLGALLMWRRPAAAQDWSERSQLWMERMVKQTQSTATTLLSPLVSWYVGLVSRTVYAPVVSELTAFLITRPVWCGSGRLKMPPTPGRSPFQLMQKSDAMGMVVGASQPGARRPIFDFKHLLGSPMAVLRPWLRLQISYSDSNMSEQISWLKLAVTGLLLQMIEDGVRFDIRLAHPLEALRRVSEDTTLYRTITAAGRGEVTALQIQAHYLEVARQYFDLHPGDGTAASILDVWEDLLRALAKADKAVPMWAVDWSAKRALMAEALQGKAGIEDLALIRTWADELDAAGASLDTSDIEELRNLLTARTYVTLNHYLHARRLSWPDFLALLRLSWQVEKMDLKYHQVGPGGYAQQLMEGGLMPRLSCPQELKSAQIMPPSTTRARIRGALVQRFFGGQAGGLGGPAQASLDWDAFHGKGRYVALGDPLEGNLAALSLN